MATIKVKFVVDELVNVMTQFDVCKVYWATTEGGVYTEATALATRVVLAVGQTLYFFDHLTGDPAYWYRVSYFNSSTLIESDPSPSFQAGNAGGYVTLQDVRDAGIADPPTDAAVVASIIQWSQFIDMATKQWFEPRTLDVKLDGTGARYLWLKVPIIGLDVLYMNNDFANEVGSGFYEVYNNLGDGLVDDRRNPKIGLSDSLPTSLFIALSRQDKFIEGKKNQQLKGTFGFVEPDGSAPALIRRAVLKLVKRELAAADPLNPAPGPSGPIVSETTDAHTIRYAPSGGAHRSVFMGITGDPEIEGIIQMYRVPRAMAVVA